MPDVREGPFDVIAKATVVVLCCAGFLQGQSVPSEKLTLARMESVIRTYLRDSAELPMRIRAESTATDLSGRVRKHKTGNVEYDFHGYNPRSQRADSNLHGDRGVVKTAAMLSMSSIFLLNALGPEVAGQYTFTVTESTGSDGLLSAALKPIPPCDPFKWSAKEQAMENFCGSSEFRLQKDDLDLKRYSFDQLALPVSALVEPFGQCTITGYHVDVDFQKTFLPGDPKPFLVPGRVTATLTTDKGSLVMTGSYDVKKK